MVIAYTSTKTTLNSNRRYFHGTDADDRLYGNNDTGTVDYLYGNAGNDYLYGQAGVDYLYGGVGNDYLSGGSGADYLSGGSGDDRLFGGTGSDRLYGGSGADRLYGGSGADQIYGGSGNDYVSAGSDNDYVHGGTGNDLIYGGTGNDRLFGGEDQDLIRAGDDDDYVSGGNGDDILYGERGSDVLYGGAGNDDLAGGSDADTYSFQRGDGQDTISDDYFYYDQWGFVRDPVSISDIPSADWISEQDVLEISGYDVSDLEILRSGSDLSITFAGTDDSILLQNQGSIGLDGVELIEIGDVTIDVDGFSNISSGTYNTVFNGTLHHEIYTGTDASEEVGLSSYDHGHGLVFAGGGNDTLTGNTGNDMLVGGTGDDVLFGGRGNDTYVFRQGDGQDVINEAYGTYDYNLRYTHDGGTADTLMMKDFDWNELSMSREGSSLVVDAGDGDSVTVSNHFAWRHINDPLGKYRIEELEVGDDEVSMDDLTLLMDQAGDTLDFMSDKSGSVFVRETSADGAVGEWTELNTGDESGKIG